MRVWDSGVRDCAERAADPARAIHSRRVNGFTEPAYPNPAPKRNRARGFRRWPGNSILKCERLLLDAPAHQAEADKPSAQQGHGRRFGNGGWNVEAFRHRSQVIGGAANAEILEDHVGAGDPAIEGALGGYCSGIDGGRVADASGAAVVTEAGIEIRGAAATIDSAAVGHTVAQARPRSGFRAAGSGDTAGHVEGEMQILDRWARSQIRIEIQQYLISRYYGRHEVDLGGAWTARRKVAEVAEC